MMERTKCLHSAHTVHHSRNGSVFWEQEGAGKAQQSITGRRALFKPHQGKDMKEGTNGTALWGRGLWAEGVVDTGGRNWRSGMLGSGMLSSGWGSKTHILALYAIRIVP